MFDLLNADKCDTMLNCHYKAKPGQLYLLEDMLFFGYKKPVFVMEFAIIKDIRVTCVTQRTFNIEIELPDTILEFQMIEQIEFPRY